MADAGTQTILSPYQHILQWSKDWPLWQQDALRRIILNGDIKAADLDELEAICRAKHNAAISVSGDPKPTPLAVALSKADIPAGPDASSSVSLVKISKPQNVNRLDVSHGIEFGISPGITVIYGDNGTGKSSYARVIKKACRARGAPPTIQPNAYDDTPATKASADVICRIGSVETPLKWIDGTPSDPRLTNVFVFDAISARFHITDDGPAAFIPRGLDVLPKLAKACDELKARFKSEADALLSNCGMARSSWPIRAVTAVGKFIDGLNEFVTDTALGSAAAFTAEQEQRLVIVNEALKSDPKKKSDATLAAARRVRTFAHQLLQRLTALEAANLNLLKAASESLASAEAAASVSSSMTFDDSFLPGTGGSAWRKLWDIARAYSTTQAYPNAPFPVTTEGSKCVLCQSDISNDAAGRLQAFETFVRNEAGVRAEAARIAFAAQRAVFEQMQPLAPHLTSIAADLSEAPSGLDGITSESVQQADLTLGSVRQFLTAGTWTEVSAPKPNSVEALVKFAETLQARSVVEASAAGAETRKALETEQGELTDRHWLSLHLDEGRKQLARFRRIALLKKCQSDTVTNSLTLKNGELYDLIVTATFTRRFAEERDALGLATMEVKLESLKGSKGERQFGLRLVSKRKFKIEDVASEGEQRCIALAAFMAELSQASHKSALVFDDPVSSLDFMRRAAVAKRLCEEAKLRQVIVFTHDPVFLSEILDAAETLKIDPACRHLMWRGTASGFCSDGLPWDWQRYKERVNALEQEHKAIEKAWSPQPTPDNVAAMRTAYSHFRSTLEKVLQDCILCSAVARFRSWIRIDVIEGIVGITDGECEEVHRLHKAACGITDAHDPSYRHPVPNPAELAKDIAALKTLIDQVNARKKAKADAKKKQAGQPAS